MAFWGDVYTLFTTLTLLMAFRRATLDIGSSEPSFGAKTVSWQ
jgi:hypothetical protein